MIGDAWQFLPIEFDFVRFDRLRLIREDVGDAQRQFVSFLTVDPGETIADPSRTAATA